MDSGLRAELKQNKPFASVEEEAFLSVARTAALLDHAMAQALKPHGVTPTQYNVLRILRGAGPGGLCRNAVGERLVRPVPDVTRLLDRMEELDLIGRARDDEDRRYVTTRISRKGLDLLGRLENEVVATHEARLGHINRTDLRALIDLLALVRERPR